MFYRAMRVIFWSAFWSAFVMAAFFGWRKDMFGVVTFLLGAAGLLVLFLFQKSKLFFKYYNSSFGDTILGISGIIFLMSDIGNLYFYDRFTFDWAGYDTLTHFFIPMLFVILAAMLYESLRIKKGVVGAIEVILVSSLTVVIFSILWELFEKQSDIWWGTKMFFDPTQPIILDTTDDLVADFYGVFIGSLLIFKNWESWNKKWLKTADDKRLTTNNL